MKEIKPQFKLARVNSDGSSEPAQIVPLTEAMDARMNRRGFLGAGLTAAAALAFIDADDKWNTESKDLPTDPDCATSYAHSDEVIFLAVSKDGSTLASASKDGTVKCWRMQDKALITSWEVSATPQNIALSPDGKLIAFRISEEKIELRNVPGGSLVNEFQASYAVFDPNGKRLILLRNKALQFYNTTGKKIVSVPIDAKAVNGVDISVDGQEIAVGDAEKLLLFDGNGKNKTEWASSGSFPVFSPDGQKIAYATDKKKIIVCQLPNCNIIDVTGSPSRINFSSDGKWLFAEPELEAWDSESYIRKDISPLGKECSMICTPDGEFVITGGKNGSIKIWRLPNLDFFACLMDVACSGQEVKGGVYTVKDEFGETRTYTLPCGTPLPAGAVCICNCVPGKAENRCTCNRVCTCLKVCTCNRVCSCLSVGTYCSCNRVCTCLAVYR